jgi:hypothetical protein
MHYPFKRTVHKPRVFKQKEAKCLLNAIATLFTKQGEEF